MELNNGIIKVEIAEKGAEVRSVIKDGKEYMWNADPKFWGRTSPILFPFVGGLKDNKYSLKGKEYHCEKHGFCRDVIFDVVEKSDISATFRYKDNDETFGMYPYHFTLLVKYTLDGSRILVDWTVINENNEEMAFSIGGHPAFMLADGDNYFKFNSDNVVYTLVDDNFAYAPDNKFTADCENGYMKMYEGMFDHDAFIIEDKQVTEVSLCDKDKNPYVTVRFDAPLFGLWHPAGTGIPFVCIEPWYGVADTWDFKGDLFEKAHIETIGPRAEFKAGYEMEFI